MSNITRYRTYLVSFVQLILFIPFYSQGFIGADWDSYASYASSYLINIKDVYIPSRPPGFPFFEYATSYIVSFGISSILIFTFVFLVLTNFVVDKLFYKNNYNDYLYFALLLSPILLISAFSIIDYTVGLFFGFSAILVLLNKKNPELLFAFLVVLACATRLSNLIFLLAGIYILHKKGSSVYKVLSTIFVVVLSLGFIYYPAYNLADGLCFLTLTNTDHSLYGRLGRFFYKQTYLLGIPASLLIIWFLIKERKEFYLIFFQRLVPYSVIFVLFQLSFLRLPTEEGHLIPALFSFFIMLSYIKIPTRTQVMVFILVFTSNFAYLDLFDFDVPNHVQKVEFAPRIESGLLVKDYQERAKKAVKEDFHIQNAVTQLVSSWSDGGPNC